METRRIKDEESINAPIENDTYGAATIIQGVETF